MVETPRKINISKKQKEQLRKKKSKLANELNRLNTSRWFIEYQWRNPLGSVGPSKDWKSWRCFAVVPILFHSRAEAQEYLNNTAFENMYYKKMSASIKFKRIK